MIQNSKTGFWLYARLALYALAPAVLLALPASHFDDGPPLCLSVLLFNQECYGCGMTRSIMHLIHFEFADAYYFNPLGFLVFPLLAFLWARWAWTDFRKWRTWRRASVQA